MCDLRPLEAHFEPRDPQIPVWREKCARMDPRRGRETEFERTFGWDCALRRRSRTRKKRKI